METQVRDPLIGRVVEERYRIESRLARGGMATVYEAIDLRLDRVVALKVMHPSLAEDASFVSRFEREAKSAARLSHPHVVSVFDQGVDGELVFLVMEYVPGRTVRDVLREHGALTPAQSLVILEPVLEALSAAHRSGFVHRDVKPENVLISNDGRIKVADFGLARSISAGSATTAATAGMLIGTVAYLSPEQVERGVADARSDVYGAGILLYEMLVGSVPHGGDSPLSVAYQHVHADVPPPSAMRAGIPPEIDALVTRATRRDPDERFTSADEFLAAVRAARASVPAPTPLRSHDTVVMPGATAATAVVAGPATTAAVATAVAAPAGAPRPPGPPSSPAPRRSRRRWRGPIALLVVLALLASAGAAAWWYGSAQYVAVPSVVNLTEAAAKARLAAVDLGLTVSARRNSETVKAGLILSSAPGSGAEARKGSAVAVVVSAGPERHEVPDVAGDTVEQATATLAEETLKVGGTKEVYSESIERGLVVGTSPETGASLRRSAEVTLLVSRGPKPVEVPKLRGDSVESATKQLEKLGLRAETTEEFSETVDMGNVISISPRAGTEVPPGSTVQLVVSKGPPPVTVPSVVDLDKQSAIDRLTEAGLKVSVEEPLDVTPLNRVLRQSPQAGTVVSKGSTVVIQVV